ncbi:MAG: zinc-dependent metalloprotease [Saprospiraceae bacterium]|nr:zinc-dependent metalloprotease [Saprospiraceae bacterium]
MFAHLFLRLSVARNCIVVFFLLTGFLTQAQSDIFQPSAGGSGDLIGEQLVRYNRYEAMDHLFSEVDVIEIGDLATLQDNGIVKVSLPGEGCDPVFFQMKQVSYDAPTRYEWYGEVDRSDTSEWRSGNLMLIADGDAKFGYLTVDDRFYNIEDLTGGKQVLLLRAEQDATACTVDAAALRPDITQEALNAPPTVQDRSENCDIRILVLYTQSVLDNASNANNIATTAIAQTKQTFLNSNISTNSVNLITAGIELLPQYSEEDKTFQDVLYEIDGLPAVTSRRNALGADLVAVLVNKNIMDDDDTPIGIAFVGANTPAAGFSVTNAFDATGKGWPFTHEIGHNLGAGHEPCDAEDPGSNCEDDPDEAHAHTWSYKKMCGCGWFWLEKRTVRRRTVMYSVGGRNPDVIQHFSNPFVKYDGKPTGIVDERHNALTIANNACKVANYRTTNEAPLSATIYGFHQVCEGISAEWYTAGVSGPPGPYTYAWQVAVPGSGGTNFGPVLSTNSFFELDLSGMVAGQYATIKLTVTKGAQSVTTYLTVHIIEPDDLRCFRSDNSDNTIQQQLAEAGAAIYPNPNDGAMTVELLTNAGSRGRVSVHNHLGQEVFVVYDGMFDAWKTTFNTELRHLSNGLYFLSVNTPDGRKTVRFVLSK